MTVNPIAHRLSLGIVVLLAVTMLGGCASTGDKSAAPVSATKFKADDGRVVEIGKASPSEGGLRYDNPHLEKGKCWLAGGFDFNGYDTLYIAPTLSTAKYPDKPEDKMVHDLAKEQLVGELVRQIRSRRIFTNVVTRESDISTAAKTLKLENTIVEFSKGGGAGRYFAGLYGAGQPILRVQGRMTEGEKVWFTYEARRSGTSAGARMSGAYMKDEDIQLQDIRSMVLDLSDFMAAIAKKYPPKT